MRLDTVGFLFLLLSGGALCQSHSSTSHQVWSKNTELIAPVYGTASEQIRFHAFDNKAYVITAVEPVLAYSGRNYEASYLRLTSALEIARKLLAGHGGLSGLASCDVATIAREHGVGSAKGASLRAAFEIGRRAQVKQFRAGDQVKQPILSVLSNCA